MRTFSSALIALTAVIIAATLPAGSAYSQFQSTQFQSTDSEEIKISARYHIQTGTDQGFLIVKLVIPDGNYIYSTTQTEPLIPSKFVVKASPQFSVGKKFKSDKQPKVIKQDPVLNARLEKHSGTVQFYAPIKVASGTNHKLAQPEVTFSGQVCSDQGFCVPINGMITKAKFAGFYERQAKSGVPPLNQKK